MKPEQKRIEITKRLRKLEKLNTYIRNNPPKTAKHLVKLGVKLLYLKTEITAIRALPNYVATPNELMGVEAYCDVFKKR